MIDLNKATALFAAMHVEYASHDEAIRSLAAHYYHLGIVDALNTTGIAVDSGGGVAIEYAADAKDDDFPPRLGCHTSNPHKAGKVGEPCQKADQNLPACAGCGRMQ